MSPMGLGRVKTQRRANCREKYPIGSALWEREQHTELRRRGIGEAGSLPFARFHVFTQAGSNSEVAAHWPRVRSTPHNGHSAAPCKNHDLCTNSLTHIKRGFMLCILYVRNGGRYGGLRICAGEHRWSISSRPISRAKSSKMRKDISGEDQRRSVGPQAAPAFDGASRKGRRVGRR